MKNPRRLVYLIQTALTLLLISACLSLHAEPLDNLTKVEALREIKLMDPQMVIALACIVALVVSQSISGLIAGRNQAMAMRPYTELAKSHDQMVVAINALAKQVSACPAHVHAHARAGDATPFTPPPGAAHA